jgi:hypothetical protein
MDELSKKAQARGSVVGREKVWGLAFAEDLVVVAESEREMKKMMKKLGKYVRKKKPEVTVAKAKRKRKNEENEWNWEGRKVEQLNEFKYLGYILNTRATDKAHIREKVRKANKAVGGVWGIGGRKWGGDFWRRLMMLESMRESILMHGAEIWGWKEQEDRESARQGVLGVEEKHQVT